MLYSSDSTYNHIKPPIILIFVKMSQKLDVDFVTFYFAQNTTQYLVLCHNVNY